MMDLRWAGSPAGGMASRLGKALTRGMRCVWLLPALALGGCNEYVLLSPQGDIGVQEKNLILIATGLMLLVVVPVIVLTLVFAWRFRATNTRATYAPKWAHSTAIEVVVWTIPCVIVAILGYLIVTTTHSLDPYKPIASDKRPVRVEVIALNWKWLFLYPDYGVAAVNHLTIPAGRPIAFRLTAQSIMNSFFIPQLGSQVYAMAGMQTQLHLIANGEGTFAGRSAAFSGAGFSDMRFDAVAMNDEAFQNWVREARTSPLKLDEAAYSALEQPSTKIPATTYSSVAANLFDRVVGQHMHPSPMNMEAVSTLLESSDLCTSEGLAQRGTN